MFKSIKHFFSIFRRITVADMARSSLAEHERELLKSQETVAFYQHDVNYRIERIRELKELLSHDKEVGQAKPEPAAQRQRSRRTTVQAFSERDPRLAAAA